MVKESAFNDEDLGSVPGSGRSGKGNGYPPQYSSLEDSMDKGAWQVTVSLVGYSPWSHKESDMTE